MMFLVDKAGVPSIAEIVQIIGPSSERRALFTETSIARQEVEPVLRMSSEELDREIIERERGTRVSVGLTSKCPYGIGACWGGAYEALQNLEGVSAVRPIPIVEDSIAEVFLEGETLPDLDHWPEQISRTANGSYHFRGVEVTLLGGLRQCDDRLEVHVPALAGPVKLTPFEEGRKLQWDLRTGERKQATPAELEAYAKLSAARAADNEIVIRVTGPLVKIVDNWTLYVRDFQISVKEAK
jgi:hypothetical protein